MISGTDYTDFAVAARKHSTEAEKAVKAEKATKAVKTTKSAESV